MRGMFELRLAIDTADPQPQIVDDGYFKLATLSELSLAISN